MLLPIETAPKDGTEIIVYGKWSGEVYGDHEGNHFGVATFLNGRWDLTLAECYSVECNPTHWVSLPPPPVQP